MRSYTITSVWGIPIRINASLILFLPILAWLIGSGEQIGLYTGLINDLLGKSLDAGALGEGATPWIVGVLAALGLFASVTLHELGHSWMALRYGIEIESITLWIFGGIASLASIPKEWNREFWIAIAGPAVSVLTAVGCYGIALALPSSASVALFVFGWLAITNVALTVFNLVPAFPMDGGRVLRALLARSRPYAVATRIAAGIGRVFAVLFAIVGALNFNVVLILVALFVYTAAASESKTVLIDELLDGISVGDIADREYETVTADTPVSALVDRMMRERRTVYPVVEDGDIVGVVALEHLRGRRGEDATVASVMAEDVLRVAPLDDAFDTLAALGQAGASYALVQEGDRVVGVLSHGDYAQAIDLQRNVRAGMV